MRCGGSVSGIVLAGATITAPQTQPGDADKGSELKCPLGDVRPSIPPVFMSFAFAFAIHDEAVFLSMTF